MMKTIRGGQGGRVGGIHCSRQHNCVEDLGEKERKKLGKTCLAAEEIEESRKRMIDSS